MSMDGARLSSPSKRGVGTLSSVFAVNHERASMSCSQQQDALEENSWTNNNIQQSHQWLRVKTWWHTTLSTALFHCELAVRATLVMSIYTKLPCNNLHCILDVHGAWGWTPRVHFISHMKLTPGWVLIQVNFWPYTGNWAKSGGNRSLGFEAIYNTVLSFLNQGVCGTATKKVNNQTCALQVCPSLERWCRNKTWQENADTEQVILIGVCMKNQRSTSP